VSAPARRSGGSGAADFDFLRGRWSVLSRRLEQPLDPAGSDWREFTMEVENQPVLGGLGNIDTYRSNEFPSRPGWEALALRLYEPETAVWRIWWVSTASPGQLDVPVVGRFAGERGVFGCDDLLDGRAVSVRYEWMVGGESPRWRQAFSFDGGRTWHENWVMEWRRRVRVGHRETVLEDGGR
jgi:hypothetical protein